MSRIGVFICHCGGNIAATVDVAAVAEAASGLPRVALAAEHAHLCSADGQRQIQQAIEKHALDKVVIGACTPRLHEATFRQTLAGAGLNPYVLETANLREQCAWVHKDRQAATNKAIELVRMAAAKAARLRPLAAHTLPLHKKALVIGGGIAGIQAALDIAEAGYPVTLLEREPSIGGKMALLDKTFPTMDCAACICTPQMAAAARRPLITLLTYSGLEKISGQMGDFQAVIRRKAAYVRHDACTGCGLCEQACPARADGRVWGRRAAIYRPFAQAVPAKPVIDAALCRKLNGGSCGICQKVCPQGCIDFSAQDEIITDTFGAIVVATGYELLDWRPLYAEYGGGRYADVITGLQFERLLADSAASGAGLLTRPSDGREIKEIAILSCVGSRDTHKGRGYCSRACCLYGAKHARQALAQGARCHVFYLDMRACGKGGEEFYRQAVAEGANYIRGRAAKIYPEQGRLICKGEDTLLGRPVSVSADMVVLETAMIPAAGAAELAAMLGLSCNADGWLEEAHAKLKPVETRRGGIFVAGACHSPKDIADSVAQASAAAAKVCALFSKEGLLSNPQVAVVEAAKCTGCGVCEQLCPYQAISVDGGVALVNAALCQGCGACAAACRGFCLDIEGYSHRQLLEEVDALCW